MKKVTNTHYRKFLDEGFIDLLTADHIAAALANIHGKNVKEGRALLITLYYTGARPNEVLRLKCKDFQKKGSHLSINLVPSKGGRPRTFQISLKKRFVTELWQYVSFWQPDMIAFYHYAGTYTRIVTKKNGERIKRTTITDKLRYYFGKWFDGVIEGGVPPYFLRHNRFSQLIQNGATVGEIQILKGARSMESVTPYIHMSEQMARNISKRIK